MYEFARPGAPQIEHADGLRRVNDIDTHFHLVYLQGSSSTSQGSPAMRSSAFRPSTASASAILYVSVSRHMLIEKLC